MGLYRLNDSIVEMHLKITSAGVICYMQMLTPTAHFAVDSDQTVPRRAVRFGSSCLLQRRLTDRQTLRIWFRLLLRYSLIRVHTVCYKDGLWVVISGKCLCLRQWPISPCRQTFGTRSDCSYEMWVKIDCFKDVFQ